MIFSNRLMSMYTKSPLSLSLLYIPDSLRITKWNNETSTSPSKQNFPPKKKSYNSRSNQTFKRENPLIASVELIEFESKGKQFMWCQLVKSKPRESLLTSPNLTAFLSIVLKHFLHEERFDLAYSTTVFEEVGIATPEKQQKEIDFISCKYKGKCLRDKKVDKWRFPVKETRSLIWGKREVTGRLTTTGMPALCLPFV